MAQPQKMGARTRFTADFPMFKASPVMKADVYAHAKVRGISVAEYIRRSLKHELSTMSDMEKKLINQSAEVE